MVYLVHIKMITRKAQGIGIDRLEKKWTMMRMTMLKEGLMHNYGNSYAIDWYKLQHSRWYRFRSDDRVCK